MPNNEGHNCSPGFWYDSDQTLKFLHFFYKDMKIKTESYSDDRHIYFL